MSKALYIQCERKLSMKLKRKISRILSMTLAIMLLVPAMCADAFNFTPTSGYDDDGKRYRWSFTLKRSIWSILTAVKLSLT